MQPDVERQFRRLLVGTVVDVLREEQVHADLAGLAYAFGPETGFRFRWVDNWMRFRGEVRVPLTAPVSAGDADRLRARFARVWPEILAGVGTLPLADPLQSTRDEVRVSADPAELVVAFDFEAD